MKLALVFLLSALSLSAYSQIQNVKVKNKKVYIELDAEYSNRYYPDAIDLRNGYVAGWNEQVVVIVADKTTGGIDIYNYKGELQANGSLRLYDPSDGKITVSSKYISIDDGGGRIYRYNFVGERIAVIR